MPTTCPEIQPQEANTGVTPGFVPQQEHFCVILLAEFLGAKSWRFCTSAAVCFFLGSPIFLPL